MPGWPQIKAAGVALWTAGAKTLRRVRPGLRSFFLAVVLALLFQGPTGISTVASDWRDLVVAHGNLPLRDYLTALIRAGAGLGAIYLLIVAHARIAVTQAGLPVTATDSDKATPKRAFPFSSDGIEWRMGRKADGDLSDNLIALCPKHPTHPLLYKPDRSKVETRQPHSRDILGVYVTGISSQVIGVFYCHSQDGKHDVLPEESPLTYGQLQSRAHTIWNSIRLQDLNKVAPQP